MDAESLLNSLNTPQQQAVSAAPGHLLILAGAGSGKTRVLAHRIAWLILTQGISPHAILSVTFTNKAAHEMRHRIESLLQMPARSMWIGTFHGLAHRLLRLHWQEAKLPESFQILDSDDQYRMIRRIQKSLQLDESRWPPKQAQWFINKNKEEGQRANSIATTDYFSEVMQRVYYTYEQQCQQSGLVDFCELLLRSLELLQENEAIRQHYQQRFQHILVDEFQDTNSIQYTWLRLLAGEHTCVMAVGDDDQSIYSWRGARIENLHRFTRDYPNCETIRLEQNYRSTQTILKAANAVIEHNNNRMGKELWTEDDKGEAITIYSAFNEQDEAHFAVATIKELRRQGYDYREMAILYRSNAQSRILEEQLIESQVAYHIYGGLKFFERAEIKDALAYLRLMANRFDDAAFERVINLPPRGIGPTTVAKLRDYCKEKQCALWQGASELIASTELANRASNSIQKFLELIDSLAEECRVKPLEQQTSEVLARSGLKDYYRQDKSNKGTSKLENLEELINATSTFKPNDEEEQQVLLDAFLAHVALEAGEGQSPKDSNCVNLMTLHAAKGLEFPFVFIMGLEEELFPHKMSLEEPQGLEEERRLCYVGMTRAMKKLYLCHAECRRLFGMEKFHAPSRFISEIPAELLDNVRNTTRVARPSFTGFGRSNKATSQQKTPDFPFLNQEIESTGLRIGQRVMHQKFGQGTVIHFEGQGEHARVQVRFDQVGEKWLVASFAKLEVI